MKMPVFKVGCMGLLCYDSTKILWNYNKFVCCGFDNAFCGVVYYFKNLTSYSIHNKGI